MQLLFKLDGKMKNQLLKALAAANKEMAKLEKLERKVWNDEVVFAKSGVMQKKAAVRDVEWHLEKALGAFELLKNAEECFA